MTALIDAGVFPSKALFECFHASSQDRDNVKRKTYNDFIAMENIAENFFAKEIVAYMELVNQKLR